MGDGRRGQRRRDAPSVRRGGCAFGVCFVGEVVVGAGTEAGVWTWN